MLIAFYFFAALLVFLSYKSLTSGLAYLRYVKSEIAKDNSEFAPFATIFAPCRGRDQDLELNLSALFKVNYPAYEIIFVTDDADDRCITVIEELRARFSNISTKLIIAGKAENESQKVHNLREAVLHASQKTEVFAFVDSDARPAVDWLTHLVAPLVDEKIGVATGYRWFISRRRNFASELLSAWNASVASALGANTRGNFCWGGSMAMRRETFESLDMREKWRGTLSDDFAVTRAVKETGLGVYFVPQCLTASFEDCNLRGLLEFTTRQMKITRVYSPTHWKMSLIGSFIFNLVMISAIVLVITNIAAVVPLIVLLLVVIFSTGKSFLRLKAVRLVLKDHERDLRKQFLTQNIFWILAPAIFLFNNIAALLSRKIVWRGISYELKSAHETIITHDSSGG